jgi:quercetin dioxygenase-like cupin family protein
MRAACYSMAIIGAALVSADASPSLARQNQPPAPVVTPLLQTQTTVSGQPLKLPSAATELTATIVTIAPGGATPIHRHPWSRFAYVEQGPLRLINHDTGKTVDFQSGSVIVESVGQWHEGRALGPKPAKLIVFDLAPPGGPNAELQHQ